MVVMRKRGFAYIFAFVVGIKERREVDD